MKEPPCEHLSWDSDFFGFPIARAVADTLTPERLVEIDAWCVENDIYCLYFPARLDHAQTIPLAEQNGFNLVNIRVDIYCPDISPWHGRWAALSEEADGVRLRLGRREDVEPLSAIAASSFSTTRFAVDPRFPAERVKAMYVEWLRASFDGFADSVIVAEVEGRPVGYQSIQHAAGERVARLSIIALDSALRGRGLGSRIIEGTQAWLAERGAQEVRTSTQGQNRAAQRLFERLGYLTDSIMLYYHKWYQEPSGAGVPAAAKAVSP